MSAFPSSALATPGSTLSSGPLSRRAPRTANPAGDVTDLHITPDEAQMMHTRGMAPGDWLHGARAEVAGMYNPDPDLVRAIYQKNFRASQVNPVVKPPPNYPASAYGPTADQIGQQADQQWRQQHPILSGVLNFTGGAKQATQEGAGALIGTVAPRTGQTIQRYGQETDADPNSWLTTGGHVLGSALLAAPGVLAPEAAVPAFFGAMGAAEGVGQGRINSLALRDRGQYVSGLTEAENAAGRGLVGGAMGYITGSALGGVGVFDNIPERIGANAIVGGATGAGQQFGENVVNRLTTTPNQPLMQGVGTAAASGAVQQGLLSAGHEALGMIRPVEAGNSRPTLTQKPASFVDHMVVDARDLPAGTQVDDNSHVVVNGEKLQTVVLPSGKVAFMRPLNDVPPTAANAAGAEHGIQNADNLRQGQEAGQVQEGGVAQPVGRAAGPENPRIENGGGQVGQVRGAGQEAGELRERIPGGGTENGEPASPGVEQPAKVEGSPPLLRSTPSPSADNIDQTPPPAESQSAPKNPVAAQTDEFTRIENEAKAATSEQLQAKIEELSNKKKLDWIDRRVLGIAQEELQSRPASQSAGKPAQNIPENIPSESAPNAGAVKQPWQMTREEFAANQNKPVADRYAQQQRDAVVKQALTAGKPVPPEVLRDYPELAGKQSAGESIESIAARAHPQNAGIFGQHVTTGTTGGETGGMFHEPTAYTGPASEDIGASKEAVRPENTGKLPFGSKIADIAQRAEDAAKARIKERGLRLHAGLDPAELADHVIVGAAKIAKGAVKFADWSTQMVKDFGEAIQPHLKRIWTRAQAVAKMDEDEQGKWFVKNAGLEIPQSEPTKTTIRRETGLMKPDDAVSVAQALMAKLKGEARGAKSGFKLGAASERNRNLTAEQDAPQTVPLASAIKSRLKAEARGAKSGFKLGAASERNRNLTAEQDAPQTVPLASAIKSRLKAEARAGHAGERRGWGSAIEQGSGIRDEIVNLAKSSLPAEDRGQMLSIIAKSQTLADLARGIKRMSDILADYQKRSADSSLTDLIGRPKAEPKQKGPNLAAQINQAVGVKKPVNPFAAKEVDPANLLPEHKNAVSPLIDSLRKASAPSATGAGKLGEFLQKETDEGRANAFTSSDLARLGALDGKPRASLSPEDTKLIRDAIAYTKHLSDQWNVRNTEGMANRVQKMGREVQDGLTQNSKVLDTDKGVGKKPILSRMLGDAQRDMSHSATINGGEAMNEHIYTKVHRAVSDALKLFWSGKDALSGVRDEHGVSDGEWNQMGRRLEPIELPNGRTIKITPRERMDIAALSQDSERRAQLRSGVELSLKRNSGRTAMNFPGDDDTINAIASTMTPFEKDAVAAARKFTNGPLRDAVNKRSVDDVGRELAPSTDHWGSSRDLSQTRENIVPAQNNWMEKWLENIGLIKPRVRSNAPLQIQDFNSRYEQDIRDLSHYAHVSGPVRDILMMTSKSRNGIGIGQDMESRLGPEGMKRINRFLQAASGIGKEPAFGQRLSQMLRRGISANKLGFRAQSFLKHFMGGSSYAYDLTGPETVEFGKQMANPKNYTDRDYASRIQQESGYFRDRMEQHGASFESPSDNSGVSEAPQTKIGDAIGQVNRVSLSGLKIGDMRDTVALVRAIENTYQKAHPEATPEDAFGYAVHKAEYVVGRNGTTSHPIDMSDFHMRYGEVPFVGLGTMFTSKLNKFRNMLDESFHNMATQRDAASAAKFAKAALLVGINAAGAAGITELGRRAYQGFMPPAPGQPNKNSFVENLLAELADSLSFGGGDAVRRVYSAINGKEAQNPMALDETIGNAISSTGQAGKAAAEGDWKKAATQAIKLVRNMPGIPSDAISAYAGGVLRRLNINPLKTDKERISELEARDPAALYAKGRAAARQGLANEAKALFAQGDAANPLSEAEATELFQLKRKQALANRAKKQTKDRALVGTP